MLFRPPCSACVTVGQEFIRGSLGQLPLFRRQCLECLIHPNFQVSKLMGFTLAVYLKYMTIGAFKHQIQLGFDGDSPSAWIRRAPQRDRGAKRPRGEKE